MSVGRLVFVIATAIALPAMSAASEMPQYTVNLPDGQKLSFVEVASGEHTVLSNSLPWFDVTIKDKYFISTHELTLGQWFSIMGYNPQAHPGSAEYLKVKAGDGTELPVQVTFAELQRFLASLNDAAGSDLYRLPTEAEWEYAATAGNAADTFFGDTEGTLSDYAWYGKNSGSKLHPVGQLKPNAWGLYDVYGNVWEWTSDDFSQTRQKVPTFFSKKKVMKGCNIYSSSERLCTTYGRETASKTGIRLVRSSAPLTEQEKTGLQVRPIQPPKAAEKVGYEHGELRIPMVKIQGELSRWGPTKMNYMLTLLTRSG